METAEETAERELAVKNEVYAPEQRPVAVWKRRCGCFVAACCLGENAAWGNGRDEALRQFIREVDDDGGTIEVRPISFVRKGGLNFDCHHQQA